MSRCIITSKLFRSTPLTVLFHKIKPEELCMFPDRPITKLAVRQLKDMGIKWNDWLII